MFIKQTQKHFIKTVIMVIAMCAQHQFKRAPQDNHF